MPVRQSEAFAPDRRSLSLGSAIRTLRYIPLTGLKRVQSLLRQPLLPEHGQLGEAHPDVLVSERRKHKLFLERAGQQIGQIPQTLQPLLGAHASGARQRVTATSSYNLVSTGYIRRGLRELLRFAGKHEETIVPRECVRGRVATA